MEMTVIPIVMARSVQSTKILVEGLEGLEIRRQVETIQTTILLGSVKILGRVLETWEHLLSFKLQ